MRLLSENGVAQAKDGEVADLVIINTCTVTDIADKKCRQMIRRYVTKHPGALVVVTGCYAQLKPDEITAIEGVDLVLGANEKMKLIDFIESMDKLQEKSCTTEYNKISSFDYSCSRGDRTRYFLKVQDGCDYVCSYCTIPFARGRSRNGEITRLVDMVQDTARQGGKEIVLTGVNVGDFGKTTGETFLDLIKALDEVDGIERFRISSIEPNLLSKDIIDFVAASKRFMPHFHLPLQSGSDQVLRLMRRRYGTALFQSKVDYIRKALPHAFIGVDVIAGAPGETVELFEESYRFISGLDISQLHVFPYSERPGTAAATGIAHKVPIAERHERCSKLLAVSDSKLATFYEKHLGQKAKVLLEHSKMPGIMHGFTENYIRIEVASPGLPDNEVVNVTLDEYDEAARLVKSTIVT